MKSLLYIGSIAVASFIQSAIAELPPRVEQLNQRFEQDKAKGLIALNERYIELFRKEMEVATKAGKIEEAKMIREGIQKLESEILELGDTLNEPEAMAGGAKDGESLLAGKTVWFPHNTKPEETVGFRFLENGEAVWIGLGGHEVERRYRKMDEPRKFFVWWPARQDLGGYEVTASEDGESATVENLNGRHAEEGKLVKNPR